MPLIDLPPSAIITAAETIGDPAVHLGEPPVPGQRVLQRRGQPRLSVRHLPQDHPAGMPTSPSASAVTVSP